MYNTYTTRDTTRDTIASDVETRASSKVLDSIGINYRIGCVPRDGRCFYSACCHLFRINHIAYIEARELYEIVQRGKTVDEREWSTMVDSTASGWADHFEICVCARLYNVSIIVANDDYSSLSIHGDAGASHTIVIRLSSAHFEPVICQAALLRHLFAPGCDYLTSEALAAIPRISSSRFRLHRCVKKMLYRVRQINVKRISLVGVFSKS